MKPPFGKGNDDVNSMVAGIRNTVLLVRKNNWLFLTIFHTHPFNNIWHDYIGGGPNWLRIGNSID